MKLHVAVNLDAFAARVGRWEKEALKAEAEVIEFTVNEAVNLAATHARMNHTYRDGPERTLTQSIQGFMVSSSEGVIEATAPHASYVEQGTKPHDIWPKAGEGTTEPLKKGQSRRDATDIGTHRVALRWTDGEGAVHFAPVVHHPGNAAMPFIQPAADAAGQFLEQMIDKRLAEALRTIVRKVK